MATTTTNYGWDIPQSTDLVKDGATAIATLGQDIDTTFVDLKGGTTGQILSKASNTDNDYTWITPNPGDITGVTAGTGLSGGGTSGDVTVSIDSTYYLFANQVRRNPVLNSAFNVWQRGTSISLAASTAWASAYNADRWNMGTGANQACTISRQATGDTTNLPNIQYCARVQRNSGQTGTGALNFIQAFDSVNAIPFAGKTVTLSFYARAGANYSATSSALGVGLYSGTGTDQQPASYTGFGSVISQTSTLTTTWQRFSYSGSLGATATEFYIQFGFTPTGTASTNDYFEITGVQLELGSAANTYMPNQPTYQGELAACQRYYYRQTATADSYMNMSSAGIANSTTSAHIAIQTPVQLRVYPTSIDYSTIRITDTVNGYAVTATSVAFAGGSANNPLIAFTVASGLTQYRPYYVGANNSTSAYLGLNAEL